MKTCKRILPYPCLMLIFSVLVSILSKQFLLSGIKFFLFQIFAIWVPGFSLVKILNLDTESDIKTIGLSYFMGYCANMLIYLCIVPFHLQDFTAIIIAAIDIICFFYLYTLFRKNRAGFRIERDIFGERICLLLIIIYLVFDFIMYSLDNAIPPMVDANVINGDVAYWIGNTIELTKEFPPKNFRSYPAPYNYHYFSSMQLALASLATGIEPVILTVVYQYIQPVFMIIFGSYLLFKEYAKRNGLVIIGMIILLFSSGFERVSIVTYREHMFDTPFGFDYGMGIFLFYIYFLLKIYYAESFRWKDCLASLFCFACLVGVKAPFAAIAIAGTGLMSLNWLFRREWKKAFLIGLPTLFIFIVLYIGVVNVSGYSGGDALSVISKTPPAEIGNMSNVNDMTGDVPVVGKVILLMYYGIISNPTVFLLMIISLIVSIINKRPLAKGSIILFAMVVIAEMITLFIGMSGNSQMYFLMCAFPVSILIFVLNTDSELNNRLYSLLLTMLILIGAWGWNEGYDTQFIGLCKTNINKLMENNEVDHAQNYSINISQMEAYEWLKTHSVWNTQVFSNKGDGLIGIISGCYLHGGTELFETVSKEEQDEYISQIKDMNCTYIIYDIAKSPDFVMLSDQCSVVFSNQSTVIYRII